MEQQPQTHLNTKRVHEFIAMYPCTNEIMHEGDQTFLTWMILFVLQAHS